MSVCHRRTKISTYSTFAGVCCFTERRRRNAIVRHLCVWFASVVLWALRKPTILSRWHVCLIMIYFNGKILCCLCVFWRATKFMGTSFKFWILFMAVSVFLSCTSTCLMRFLCTALLYTINVIFCKRRPILKIKSLMGVFLTIIIMT